MRKEIGKYKCVALEENIKWMWSIWILVEGQVEEMERENKKKKNEKESGGVGGVLGREISRKDQHLFNWLFFSFLSL